MKTIDLKIRKKFEKRYKKISKLELFFRKLKRELITPRRKYIFLFCITLQIFRILIDSIGRLNSKKNILIWDLRSSPITFDFLYTIFVGFYSFNAPKNGFDLIIFIPKNCHEYFYGTILTNPNYSQFVNIEEYLKRVDNMILPLAKSFNCINNIYFENDEKNLKKLINNSKIYPRLYHPKYFRPDPLSYLDVDKIIRTKKIVLKNFISIKNMDQSKLISKYDFVREKFITFTIRDYGWSKGRNSSQYDIDKAYEFAKEINAKLIIIPDDLNKLENYNTYDLLICESARLNMNERIYLYRKSIVNINPQGGPSHISILMENSKVIIINFASDSFDGNPEHCKKEYGINYGEQPYLSLQTYLMWHGIYKNYTAKDLKQILKKIS